MSIIDLTSTFHSYVSDSHIGYNHSWNTSNFIKSANAALQQMSVLQQKLAQLKKVIKSSSRFDREQNNKMIMNIKQSIKSRQQGIKRLGSVQADVKGGYKMGKMFQQAVLSALQLRLLKVTFQFKQAYEQNIIKGQRKGSGISSSTSSSLNQRQPQQINLNKSHFLTQTQQQLIQQTSINEYKQIQKSLHNILQMYKSSSDAVILQGYMIDQIENHVMDIDDNVQKGKRNISEVHRRQTKNRQIILKMFAVLYVVTFLYIVVLS